ncbi:hopanoid biosynthesis-associated protein HpnK [Lichenifustis flavocetrariae]|uniref:Hopanoid biosynthesis-associated protein HpnK n=1 Tax=Lichenifustis flavocetrariae TaxID=2949735 RepID=A0AA41Z0T4_9HYPH|nr:hopanoid biosynthesis-associated protein HpnK [Lichenifustis flavocetrariae]MCW6508438.1 hopanoid biosynthesis-associated protein HpnK [Lichenifustis flavocetrariae]
MKHLIVTADDFGLAREVNEAVELAHTRGVLTAASLMVGAPACADAVERARRLPGLRVGLHLTLLEAPPVLSRAQIPDLVGPDGLFRTDMARAGADMFFRKNVQAQLAAEIEAQFSVFAATGLALDHVNAHKHFHLHPTVATLLMRIGPRYGMRSVRVPDEPHVMIRAIDPKAPRLTPLITQPWTQLLKRRLRWAGFRVPDHVFGLAWSGGMTEQRLAALLVHPPQGVTEIYTHPAMSGGYLGAAPGYRYSEELAGLMSDSVRVAALACGATWGGYGDVAGKAA